MPLTVGEVFTRARDQHPAFSEVETPPLPLLRFLSDYREELIAEIVARYPDPVMRCTERIDFPLADHHGGAPFPANLFARGDRAWYDEKRWRPLKLVRHAQRHTIWPAAALKGNRIYPSGAARDWAGVAYITVDYVPWPAPLDDEPDPIAAEFDPLPDYARPALVWAAAAWMGKRTETADFFGERDEARERFLTSITNQRRASPLRITEGS